MRYLNLILCCFLVSALASCNEDVIYTEEVSIQDRIWSANEPATFTFDIKDSTQFCDLFILIRGTEDYSYSNLYLFTTLYFPNNKIAVDTLNCILADPSGKWMGAKYGGVFESKIRISDKKAFPLTGTYKMEINQAMRDENLEGISDIGFSISKIKK